MRPKLIALIAFSAFALVGCATSEPSVEPTATVTVTATPEPEPTPEPAPSDKPSSLIVEDSAFADFAETRASVHGAKKPNREKVIDALYEFCEDGTPFDVSKTDALNENLDAIAKKEACPNAN